MLNLASSIIKNNSIAELTIVEQELIRTYPIIYSFNQGKLIFTPLSMSFGITTSNQIVSISVTTSAKPNLIVILEGNIIPDNTIDKYEVMDNWISTNSSVSKFLKTKKLYMSGYLEQSIFSFIPQKIKIWNSESDEYQENEVFIP